MLYPKTITAKCRLFVQYLEEQCALDGGIFSILTGSSAVHCNVGPFIKIEAPRYIYYISSV